MTEPKKKATRKKAAAASPAPESVAAPAAPGQRVGYVRVSTADQNTARQLDGVPGLNRVFVDHMSGKDTNRPQLREMVAYVREGDTVTVHSLDRLGRNAADLRALVDELTSKGVRVEFLKENLTFAPGGSSSMSHLMLGILSAFAEFERALMLERQREGIKKAQQAGKYKGRAFALSGDLAAELLRRVAAGENRSALAREFGIGRATLYRYIEEGAASSAAAPAAPAPEPVAAPALPVPAPVPVKVAPRRGPVPAALRRVLAALKDAGTVAQWDSSLARWVAGGEVVQRGQLEKLVERGELVREGEGGAAIYRRA